MFCVDDARGTNSLNGCTQTLEGIHFLDRDVIRHDDCCLHTVIDRRESGGEGEL